MQIQDLAPGDIPQVLSIYRAAQQALKQAGVDQWQDGYPNAQTLGRDMAQGVSRVCCENGRVLATAAAYVGHEPTYDQILEGAWLTRSSRYGIIHRIAVLPDEKKRGLASALMDYTAELARAEGVCSLRCDTHRHNLAMQRTLEKSGFVYCGLIYLPDGSERLAYERLL